MAAATAAAAAALRPHITLLSGGSGPIPSTTLQIQPSVSPLPFGRRGRIVLVPNASSSPSSPPTPEKEAVPEAVPLPTAESCVNLGLELFSKGRVRDALEQFENALELNPTPIEAQAALYNKACCHAYREESKKAAECLRTALRDYNLKFGTILNDPDLATFRASPEFKELQEEGDFEKGTESIAAKSRLKAEVRFKADIVSPEQWESWIRDQQESEGVTPGEDVYIILRLDGRVRRSGIGMPNWNDILQELPRLEDLMSKLER